MLPLITGIVSALAGVLAREICEFLVRPVLSWLFNRTGFDTHQRRSPLQRIRDLDEVCARDVPVREDELCDILRVNTGTLCRLWKEEGAAIQPGYIIEKTRSGYWTVQKEQVS